jgi:hypothetical protein
MIRDVALLRRLPEGKRVLRETQGAFVAENEEPIDLFEKVDFEAWNGPDWDLLRKLHSDDVHVEMFGDKTE